MSSGQLQNPSTFASQQQVYQYPGPNVQATGQNPQNVGNYSRLEAERERSSKKEDNDPEGNEILGKGPGGVPQKYFMLEFEDFFAEHEKTKTIPVLYEGVGLAFKYTKLAFYHICVIILGIPMAIIWAFINGLTAFVLVWIWGPILRHNLVLLYAAIPAVTVPFRALFAPMVDVFARLFRQCRINVNVDGGFSTKRLAGEEHTA